MKILKGGKRKSEKRMYKIRERKKNIGRNAKKFI